MRTSVRSDAGSPSSGVFWRNPVSGLAAAHTASPSTSPSISGPCSTRQTRATGGPDPLVNTSFSVCGEGRRSAAPRMVVRPNATSPKNKAVLTMVRITYAH